MKIAAKTRKWLIGVLVGVVLAAALAWAFAPRPLAVELALAREAAFETTIDEDGKTRLQDRYLVSAPLAGRLARITLREGDAVREGEVVARLMPVFAPMLDERSRRELQAREQSAQAQIDLAAARVQGAEVGLRLAQTESARSEQLSTQGFVAAAKLEADRLAVQAARMELDAAGQARHVAEHELQVARAALAAVRAPAGAAARSFAVRAPVGGRVLKVVQGSENVVALGAPLLELGDTARLEIVAELLTTDALRLAPAAPVRIEAWGGPGTLQGRVRRVDPAAFTKISALGVEEQRVNVVIDISSARAQWATLGDGYRVSVRIVTLALPQALQVPVAAVFPRELGSEGGARGTPGIDGAAAMAAFVVEGGRARKVDVELGARNASMAWIKSGLKAGDKLIVYPGAAVRDGVRVSERKP